MTHELFWLVLTIMQTGLMWIPYMVDRIMVRGFEATVDNPGPNAIPQSLWAQRLMAAHTNSVENLVLFAPLVIILHLLNISNDLTITACVLYFSARLAHAVIYAWGVPLFRTLSFLSSYAALIILVLAIFRIVD
jgi:uncharacterized MAPEG superfamily protein